MKRMADFAPLVLLCQVSLETGLKHTYTWIAEQVKAQMKEGTSIAEL